MARHKNPDPIEMFTTSVNIPLYLHEMAKIFKISLTPFMHTALDEKIMKILSEDPDWIKNFPTDPKSRSFLSEFDHHHKTSFATQRKFYPSLTIPDVINSLDDMVDITELMMVLPEQEQEPVPDVKEVPPETKPLPKDTKDPEITRRIQWFGKSMNNIITVTERDDYIEKMKQFKVKYKDAHQRYEKRMNLARDYYTRIHARAPRKDWDENGLEWESPYKESIEMTFYSIFMDVDSNNQSGKPAKK